MYTIYREKKDTQKKHNWLTLQFYFPLMDCPIYGLTSRRYLFLKKIYYITCFNHNCIF